MKRIASIWLYVLMVLSSVVTIINFPTALGAGLIIGDDETVYVAFGLENWDDITVLTTGKLVVPTGAMLNAININLQGASIVEVSGGIVNLQNPDYAGDVIFNGTCSYFNVTDFASI